MGIVKKSYLFLSYSVVQGVRKKVSSLNMSLSRKFWVCFSTTLVKEKQLTFFTIPMIIKLFKVVFIKVIDKRGLHDN